MMQDIGRRYVRVINSIHGRSGTLWEGRFKTSLIDSESYLLTCHRYIECNPVRAHMAPHAGAYPWSSHAHYAGCRVDRLITAYPQYHALGTSEDERRTAFRSLFAIPLEQRVLEEICTAINTDSAFGSERFMQEAEAQLGRSVRPPQRGRPRKDVTEKLL
jgi:REP-associated tyrosine transposase